MEVFGSELILIIFSINLQMLECELSRRCPSPPAFKYVRFVIRYITIFTLKIERNRIHRPVHKTIDDFFLIDI